MAIPSGPIEPWRAVVRPVDGPDSVEPVRRAVLAAPGGVALESAATDGRWGRYSIFSFQPSHILSIQEGDPFAALAGLLARGPRVDRDSRIPFIGGWIGCLAYEAGRFCEPRGGFSRVLPGFPLARWGRYDTALVRDHSASQWYAVGAADPAGLPDLAGRLDQLERLAADAIRATVRDAGPASRPSPSGEWDMSKPDYLAMVRRALDDIAAGDVFQVNLARCLSAAGVAAPAIVYNRLCAANPAAFAAYVPIDPSHAVVSSSPELFLRVEGDQVTTRPIKGTRRRGDDARRDADAIDALRASEKDAAELNMIIDLERNDLGRVCRTGSVEVCDAGAIEKHPTVLHRVATIRGRLRTDCNAIDLLRAAFPGGSVTGAPKVRAMQIIDELERSPRGPYCGAIGWIGFDGDMALNLAIRTMLVGSGQVRLWAGGGIVADSEPEAEYEETLAKAEGMLRALR